MWVVDSYPPDLYFRPPSVRPDPVGSERNSHNDQRDDKESGSEVGRNNRSENTWIKQIEMRSGPIGLEWV